MEKLIYTGHKAGIYIPAINKTVKVGEVFETTEEIAASLKLQGCFKNAEEIKKSVKK